MLMSLILQKVEFSCSQLIILYRPFINFPQLIYPLRQKVKNFINELNFTTSNIYNFITPQENLGTYKKFLLQSKNNIKTLNRPHQHQMLQQIILPFYLVFLILAIIFIGLNYYKIRDKYKTNPDIVLFLIPFIINFIIAKFFFISIDPLLTTLIPCLFMIFIGRKLKNIRIFGLTGSIATGKSTLATQMRKNLSKLHVIDCDQITTNLRKKNQKGYKLIVNLLGDKAQDFIDTNSEEIDRQKLSSFVFQNPSFRRQLTTKMGNLIFWQILKDILMSIIASRNLIMIDAPILYESKVLEYFCFPIIVVGCSEQQQIVRLEKRNKYSREEAVKRIRAQMPLSLKQKKSDIYVKNEGTQEDLLKNTLSKLNKYLAKK